MKELKKYSSYLVFASFAGIILAAYGAFSGSDLWLAPTQWLEVTIITILYAIYLKHEK